MTELQWFAVERDFVMVHGADALTFLHSQISQEVRELPVGQSVWSFVLQPTGKLDALVRVTRSGDAAFVLDVDGGFGEAVLARLNRFRIRVKADLTPIPWRMVAVRGSGAEASARSAEGSLAVPCGWPGVEGVDLIGPSPVPPAGASEGSAEQYERLRVEAGWPAMGAEVTDDVIPAETGVVDVAVSFTKGCYPGQELVERMDSRGANAPRRLRRLVLPEGAVVEPSSELTLEGKVVGRVTSVAGLVGLAYVGRAVTPPAVLDARGIEVVVEA